MNEDPGGGEGSALPRMRVSALWWELGGDISGIETCAESWRTLADQARLRADHMIGGTTELLSSEWVGVARDSFADQLGRLVDDLDEVQGEADAVARQVDGLAGVLTSHQEALDQARSTIMRQIPSHMEGSWLGGVIVFSPRDDDEVAAVRAAVDVAGSIREDFDKALAGYQAGFSTGVWSAISRRWLRVATGAADPFELPPEAGGTSLLFIDGSVVINTGTGDDDVSVTVDPETGQVIVSVNGQDYQFAPGTPITIRTGDGHDIVQVSPGVNVNLVLLGGRGNDRTEGGGGNETILGGQGRDDLLAGDGDDYLSGGAGLDYLEGQGGGDRLSGGRGDDTIYGLGGDNYLAGGEGDDYLEGGRGNDTLDGGTGDDAVSGGRGDDTLRGGGDDDVFYGGHGTDTIDGGSGDGTAYRQNEDRTTNVTTDVRIEITDDAGFINIDGSPEFVERVEADLDMLRASPTGQQMLTRLEEMRDPNFLPGQRSLTIRELENDFEQNRPNQPGTEEENGYARSGGFALYGNNDARISYNPSYTFDRQDGRPVVILYHEMGHIYSYWNGNYNGDEITGGPDDGIKKAERQAVGLPYDHDDDPNTPDRIDPDQPLEYTENGLRAELGLPSRDTYK